MVVASVPVGGRLVVGSRPELISHGSAMLIGSELGVAGGVSWEPAALALFDVRSGQDLARASATLCPGDRGGD